MGIFSLTMSLEETLNNEITAIDKKIEKNNEERSLLKKVITESTTYVEKKRELLNYTHGIHKKEILLTRKSALQWVLQIKKTD